MYRDWQDVIATRIPGVEVWPVEYPGHGTRLSERLKSDLASLLSALESALLPIAREGRFAFFGHSMGGNVAAELARSLHEKYALQPAKVILSATPHPEFHHERTIFRDASAAALRELLPPELLANEALLALTVPILKADFSMSDRYSYDRKASFAFPVALYGGTEDEFCVAKDFASWRKQLGPACVSERMFAGKHFFIFEPAAKRALLETIAHELDA